MMTGTDKPTKERLKRRRLNGQSLLSLPCLSFFGTPDAVRLLGMIYEYIMILSKPLSLSDSTTWYDFYFYTDFGPTTFFQEFGGTLMLFFPRYPIFYCESLKITVISYLPRGI